MVDPLKQDKITKIRKVLYNTLQSLSQVTIKSAQANKAKTIWPKLKQSLLNHMK
jgi:hypothetical protein